MISQPLRRQILCGAVIFAALVLADLLCWMRMSAARAAAQSAADELASCRATVARINLLREKPAVIAPRDADSGDASSRIQSAAAGADMPDGAIERIDPEPPQPVSGTPYRRKPVRVRLARVTMQQVFTFLHSVGGDGADALHLSTIRLSAPRGEESGDRWNVEALLSSLSYDPKAAASPSITVD